MKTSVSLMILAYNEEKNLKKTVDTCNSVARELFDDYELIICDDGSSDKTGEIAEQLARRNKHIRVFHNKKNMGVGYSFQKGVLVARKRYSMWVPGDNEVKREAIKAILQHAGEADMVISYIKNTNVRPLYRQIVSASFTKIMNILFGLNLKHFLGMVLCETKLVRKLKLTTSSNGLWAEIIIKLIKTCHTYKEVPINMRKKKMTLNIFRPKNLVGLLKTVIKLFILLQLKREKNIFKYKSVS